MALPILRPGISPERLEASRARQRNVTSVPWPSGTSPTATVASQAAASAAMSARPRRPFRPASDSASVRNPGPSSWMVRSIASAALLTATVALEPGAWRTTLSRARPANQVGGRHDAGRRGAGASGRGVVDDVDRQPARPTDPPSARPATRAPGPGRRPRAGRRAATGPGRRRHEGHRAGRPPGAPATRPAPPPPGRVGWPAPPRHGGRGRGATARRRRPDVPDHGRAPPRRRTRATTLPSTRRPPTCARDDGRDRLPATRHRRGRGGSVR